MLGRDQDVNVASLLSFPSSAGGDCQRADTRTLRKMNMVVQPV